jgi:acetyl esterase/lipase
MASWQAHVVNFLTRRFVRVPLLRSPTLATIRKVFNARQPPIPKGCTAIQANIGGIDGERMTVEGMTATGTMLYLHGGAFVACSPITHRPLTSWFAKRGWRVFAPDYRLAPEFRFPAQIEDITAVYRAMLDRGVNPKQLVVAGDSAGGNLALALCLSLRSANLPQPAALALMSPVTDLAWSGDSIRHNTERCAMFSQSILPVGAELYLGRHDPRDPLVSPYYADLDGLPPMIFHVGRNEILLDDSVRMAEQAQAAGIDVQIKTWPVVPHVWQMLHRWLPEGRQSLETIDDFLRANIKR